MRKFLTMTLAAAAMFVAGAFVTGAQAAPGAPSSALSEAAKQNSLTQDVAYVCRRVWRHGYWQRRCFHTGPSYYGGYGGYGGYSYYAPRPYYGYGYGYGGGWRHHRRW